MKIKTNAVNRKDVVKAVSEIVGEKAKYLGVPSCAYQIGECTVSRAGEVEVEDEKLGELVLSALEDQGLAEQEEEIRCIEIQIPMGEHTGLSLKNLVLMIHSKQYLLNKSVGSNTFHADEEFVTALLEKEFEGRNEFIDFLHEYEGNKKNKGFYFTEDAIIFDGFPMSDDSMALKAYTEIAAMMCIAACSSKRVNPKETIEENEKYYMRVWLLRIGLGGQGGRETRKVLLSNLKGHSAFRTQEEIERAKIRNKQRAEAAKGTKVHQSA